MASQSNESWRDSNSERKKLTDDEWTDAVQDRE
jgi:hypothetical protein